VALPAGNGLSTGDAVIYHAEGASAIGGLTDGQTYYVNVQGNGAIKLYSTQADAIDSAGAGNNSFVHLTSNGSGTAQNFTFSPSIHFNPAAPSVVDTTNSAILLPPQNGLSTGDAVVYDAVGNVAIGGLTSGSTYYVNVQSNGTIKLYANQADALDNDGDGNASFVTLTSQGSGSDQKFVLAPSVHFNPTALNVVSTTANTVALPAGNGLSTGDAVTYDALGHTAIGGLTSGQTYFVNVQANGSIKLYNTAADATDKGGAGNGNFVDLTSSGSGSDQRFVTLETVKFNPTGTTNFIYAPTAGEINTLKSGIKKFTPDQLLYGISQGLMSDVTNHTPVVKDPNIFTQGNVTLKAAVSISNPDSGSVGKNSGSTVIPLPPPVTGYTTPQLLALATAERTDVQFLGADPIHATVNFSGHTITRTDASDWGTDLNVGDFVTIDGDNGQVTRNATNSNVFYKITAISGNTLTVDGTLTGENAKQIILAPIVLDPLFEAQPLTGQTTPAKEAVNQVQFVANGFDETTGTPVPGKIVRADGGSWIADGFQNGDLLQVSGPPDSLNSTGPGLVYHVTDVTADTLTLSNGSVIFAEGPENISIGRGSAPHIADIKISQVSPFKVNAGGTINIQADKSVYLDSDQTIRVDQVVAGKTENYGDNIRIATIGQTQESILDATGGAKTNIEGQNLLLESATGTIGGSGGATPITIDLVKTGTLTARAQGDVSISAVNGALPGDNAGNLYLQHVFSSNGDAYLTAYNSILDPFDNVSTIGKDVQINAHHITLNAIHG
ncbi:MAG TPA: hypothetical protein VFN80_08010, partial [Acidothermaceae bacterium]|nr:hypothetical protein [Acidothermaceae bacterium]